MKTLIIKSKTHGNQTVVYDDEFESILYGKTWMLTKKGHKLYTYCQKTINNVCKTTYMHRLIMSSVMDIAGGVIDHKNGDTLNNCLSNLRLVTQAQNMLNRDKNVNNKSGYKGVSFHYHNNLYRARLKVNGKDIFLKYFRTAKEAAKAYNEAAIKYHGEFARLNKL